MPFATLFLGSIKKQNCLVPNQPTASKIAKTENFLVSKLESFLPILFFVMAVTEHLDYHHLLDGEYKLTKTAKFYAQQTD